jgi:hypothetical protein
MQVRVATQPRLVPHAGRVGRELTDSHRVAATHSPEQEMNAVVTPRRTATSENCSGAPEKGPSLQPEFSLLNHPHFWKRRHKSG